MQIRVNSTAAGRPLMRQASTCDQPEIYTISSLSEFQVFTWLTLCLMMQLIVLCCAK